MATVRPSGFNLNNLRTDGERDLARLLQTLLPDSAIHLYFGPRISDRATRNLTQDPDIVLWLPSHGLLILEVKDKTDFAQAWSARKQAVAYGNNARAFLSKLKSLTNESGHLLFPITQAVVWTNLRESEVEQLNEAAFDSKCLSFAFESLQYSANAMSLIETFSECFAFFPKIKSERIDKRVFSALNRRLDPTPLFTDSAKRKVVPTNPQLEIAVNEDNRILISGPPGAGKTVSLISKIKSLALEESVPSRIMVTCYNTMLLQDIKMKIRQGISENNQRKIEIVPFVTWFQNVLNLPKDDYDISSDRIEHAKSIFHNSPHLKYNAIFVDEAQIFDHEWIDLLVSCLVNPDKSPITLCFGDGQTARARDRGNQALSDRLVSEMMFKRLYLGTVLRNRKRLAVYAQSFCDTFGIDMNGTFEVDPEQYEGFLPDFLHITDYQKGMIPAVRAKVSEYLENYKPEHILITSYERAPLKFLQDEIQIQGVSFKQLDCAMPGTVTLATHKRVAGIEYRVVIALECEHRFSTPNSIYVVITRATEELCVMYARNEGCIPQMIQLKDQLQSNR